jgi:hypothetical protein
VNASFRSRCGCATVPRQRCRQRGPGRGARRLTVENTFSAKSKRVRSHRTSTT